MKNAPHLLSATDAAREICEGRLSSVDLVKACLTQIDKTEPGLGAWAWLDREGALAQAARMDDIRRSGRAIGALHGVPVGLKDIIDTRSMPTQRGTPIFAGRQPAADAAIVERLAEAGAVILGKTVTTELAFVHASETRNPHNADHSPGGSSSGSAAAVAAHQVPLAIGTQTNGSVIRPASFCGVYGFKPTRGMISRRGILQTAVSLDQVGCFARSLEDAALLSDVISGYDPTDPLSFARPRPSAHDGCGQQVPVEPDFAWFNLPFNDRLTEATQEGLSAVKETLGTHLLRLDPAAQLADLVAVQGTIHEFEICQHLAATFDARWDQISPTLQPIVTRGRQISQAQYEDAMAVKTSAEAFFAEFFQEFDAIIAPAAAGEAPLFGTGTGTGDPIFCTLWTLAGLPSVTIPLLVGETGLPVGVQLIGASERDDQLMRTAAWFQTHVAAAAA
jgi:Asp-tRNA(Asn)/Glu-tRNA(Gln) amidotransferase A subunit family amidase